MFIVNNCAQSYNQKNPGSIVFRSVVFYRIILRGRDYYFFGDKTICDLLKVTLVDGRIQTQSTMWLFLTYHNEYEQETCYEFVYKVYIVRII